MKYAIATALSMLTMPAVAQEYRTVNYMKVNPLSAERFVISGVPNFVPGDYWCAAADYAQKVLDVAPDSRVYVVGDRVRGQRTVTFSTTPNGTAAAQGKVSGRSVWVDGVNRRVATAYLECFERRRSNN